MQAVIDVLAKHAQCAPEKLKPEVVLADVGVNSLKFIVVLLEIEQVTGKKVMDINKIGGLKTVGEVRELSDATLLSLQDLGKASLAELRQTLGLPSTAGVRPDPTKRP